MERLVKKGAFETEGYQQHAEEKRKSLQHGSAELCSQVNMHYSARKDAKAAKSGFPYHAGPRSGLLSKSGFALPGKRVLPFHTVK